MRRKLPFGVVALVLVAGCDAITGACTLIGCVNQLRIKFDKPAAFPFQVEVSTWDGVTHTLKCTEISSSCDANGVTFYEFTPRTLTVKVATPSGTTSSAATPDYKTSRPNGPNCEPECTQGAVTVPIAGS